MSHGGNNRMAIPFLNTSKTEGERELIESFSSGRVRLLDLCTPYIGRYGNKCTERLQIANTDIRNVDVNDPGTNNRQFYDVNPPKTKPTKRSRIEREIVPHIQNEYTNLY